MYHMIIAAKPHSGLSAIENEWHLNLCFVIEVQFEIAFRFAAILPEILKRQIWTERKSHTLKCSVDPDTDSLLKFGTTFLYLL